VFITIKERNIAIKFYIYIGMILFLLYTVCYYYWANISAGGLLEPKGIILPVASVATQTWLNYLIYLCLISTSLLQLVLYHYIDTLQ
jgi:hypothetical protein